MPQPFDTVAFHEIAVPPWVEETIGCGYTLSVMDGPARQRAAAHGVTISEMGFVDPFYDYRFTRLDLEPDGRELEFETAPTGTIVVVPRLDVHAIVVAELEEEASGR